MDSGKAKRSIEGTLVKLLFHQRVERGMRLIPEQSRCVRAGEVHELVTTDHSGLSAGSTVDRVGFLGFVEIEAAGVLDVGDDVLVGDRRIGVLAGFDECHFPNHYNVLIATDELQTAATLDLVVGQRIGFAAGIVPAEGR
ncbi:DUF6917 domain-containing protein [Lentzea sp.]|uniref:DUF6917 domain-containing protein n=1 Tax=Lentzea sp. TaxID=56099 RepID=UPI002C68B8F4|nr:hypothetical protein [Lentzea sp.]HUQ56461.1 hypothetical protein [Lentzea sp.]